MDLKSLVCVIKNGELDGIFARLYGKNVESARRRYLDAIENFAGTYGADRDVFLFSVPGRSELSGNHTDHNRGCVIAASVDLDIVCVAAANDSNIIRIKSDGYGEDVVNIDEYRSADPSLFGRSCALVAGVCDGMRRAGRAVCGFDAYTTSSVPGGSGLSSSAAFENMVGTVLDHFANDGKIEPSELAKISQYAENEFFGKPCGLMDQVACAVGGVVAIDFAVPSAPIIEKIDADIDGAGYALCIVKTGGNHADLTDDYAAIPAEMRSVAAALGVRYLRESSRDALLCALPELRGKVGDRAILRAFHFFDENERVERQKEMLKQGDIEGFFGEVIASGRSSFSYLQNVYTTKNTAEQGVSLALCLAESELSARGGAWRVHGGGFAGTIQAFVKKSEVEEFKRNIEKVLGEGACLVLSIRPDGAIKLI